MRGSRLTAWRGIRWVVSVCLSRPLGCSGLGVAGLGPAPGCLCMPTPERVACFENARRMRSNMSPSLRERPNLTRDGRRRQASTRRRRLATVAPEYVCARPRLSPEPRHTARGDADRPARHTQNRARRRGRSVTGKIAMSSRSQLTLKRSPLHARKVGRIRRPSLAIRRPRHC